MPNPALKLWHDYRNFPGIQARLALGPDIPCVRAGTATFEDWEQLIRTVAANESGFTGARRVENFARFSEELSGWSVLTNVTVVDDADSINGVSLSKLTDDATNASHNVADFNAIPTDITRSVSLYVKAGTSPFIIVATTNFAPTTDVFNASTGQWTETDTYSDHDVEDLGDGFYRISFISSIAPHNDMFIGMSDDGINKTYSGSGNTIFVGGVQVENVSGQADQSPSEYQRTTTVPAARFYATNKNGGPLATPIKGRRIHSARTNLLLQSQNVTLAPWTTLLTPVINPVSTIAPDGTMTMNSINDNNGAGFEAVVQQITIPDDSADYTFSMYIEKTAAGSAPTMGVNIVLIGGTNPGDLPIPRIFTDTGFVQDLQAGTNSRIVDAGDYWRLISTVGNNSTGHTIIEVQIYPATAANGFLPNVAAAVGINRVWGMQMEVGAFPTNYMPTLGASVTRNADVPSTTDVSFYNPARGIVYSEASAPFVEDNTAASFIFALDDSSVSDRWLHVITGSGAASRLDLTSGSVEQARLDDPADWVNDIAKRQASGAQVNDVEHFVDGVRVGTGDQIAVMPVGINRLLIGTSSSGGAESIDGDVAQIRYYDLDPDLQFQEDLTNGLITEEDELPFVRPLVRPLTRDMVRVL